MVDNVRDWQNRIRQAADDEDNASRHLHNTVNAARAGGIAWVNIGAILGITRQAAQKRFGRMPSCD